MESYSVGWMHGLINMPVDVAKTLREVAMAELPIFRQDETQRIFIGGAFVDSASDEAMATVDPSSGGIITHIPAGSPDDVENAYQAAAAAFDDWRNIDAWERGSRVRELARRIREEVDRFASIDALEGGNPLTAMQRDVRSGANFLDYFGGLALELKGDTIPVAGNHVDFTVREPFGVVGVITAFNHPLLFAASRIAASLVAGNTVVLKPSELTSLSTLEMCKIIQEVFPPGVVNVVTGNGPTVGGEIAGHPFIPRLFFTGGVGGGRAVYERAATHFKNVTLELGGKNPLIVFPDVDMDEAVEAAVASMNFRRSQGQSCGSASRLFLHDDIHDDFVARLVDKVKGIRLGLPTSPETEMGPLVSRAQYDKTLAYVRLAQEEGARLLTGGTHPEDPALSDGYFVEPAVVEGVRQDMRIAQEEVFGPVLSVLRWSDAEAVIRDANSVSFGLTANIWTNDITTAHTMARRLEAGYVWINGYGRHHMGAPFGGYKGSGIGRQESFEELLSCTQVKNVHVQLRGHRVNVPGPHR